MHGKLLALVVLLKLPWPCREKTMGTHCKFSRQHLVQGVSPEHRVRALLQAPQARPTLMLVVVDVRELDAVLLVVEEVVQEDEEEELNDDEVLLVCPGNEESGRSCCCCW